MAHIQRCNRHTQRSNLWPYRTFITQRNDVAIEALRKTTIQLIVKCSLSTAGVQTGDNVNEFHEFLLVGSDE